jgi:glycosyltransferase involved in cell wall biosynthesis
MPYFSVIIPVYNRSGPVRAAVASVLEQTFADYECIIIDDGSTDGVAALEREFSGKVKYLRQEHRGVSAARNAGVKASSGPWIAFLDSDDRWLPGKLARQAAYIRDHPGVMIHQTDEQWIRKGRPVNPGLRHLKREGRIFIDSLELCLISPSAAVLSRECFDRYGPFDEDLPACEDYDLWLRITKDEWAGLIPERLVVRNGGHPDQLSARYPGMDRFRVYSILRLLTRHSGDIAPEYREHAAAVALKKARILHAGAKKRNRTDYAGRIESVTAALSAGEHDFGDITFLLHWED